MPSTRNITPNDIDERRTRLLRRPHIKLMLRDPCRQLLTAAYIIKLHKPNSNTNASTYGICLRAMAEYEEA